MPRVLREPGIAIVFLLCIVVHGSASAAREAIASAHPLATQAGMQILAEGGNAFDAAVAVAGALAVVEPFASGLGGGGFFLLHRASDGRQVMVDARETAPGQASPQMYLDESGNVDNKSSLEGMKAAAIPGVPAGLAWLASRYGKLPLTKSLAPAVRLAREGFRTDERYAFVAGWRKGLLRSNDQLASTFLDRNEVPSPGYLVKQPQLAATLETFARLGADGFYTGDNAARMVKAVQAGGGIWTLEDLRRYKVVERTPQRFMYGGVAITCASLPSAGGLTLAQTLQILERYPIAKLSDVDRIHVVAESLRRGYQDRARYLGDPAFVEIPEELATRAYADSRAADIDMNRATSSEALAALHTEGADTTHFSVIDAAGNRAAGTLSINLPFGAGVVAGDTGVVLNNEMNDFAIAKDTPNAYRLTGGAANRVEAGKRPLSSMTPTFVEDARGVLVLGTPGGSRIISMVLLGILSYVHSQDVDIERLVSAPRYHHQYLPDRIEYEPGAFPAEWIQALQAKGHTVQEGRRRWGNMQAVYVDKASGQASAYSDPRGRGAAMF